MKIAGCLALALALVLGIWAATDYHGHQKDMQYAVERVQAALAREMRSGVSSDSAVQEEKEIEAAEQYDAIIGIAAACALIVGIALFSKGGKRAAATAQ
jgi:hypothetical protein